VRFGYAVVTPVCDEARNLRRLYDALAAQTSRPLRLAPAHEGTSALVAALRAENSELVGPPKATR